MKKSKLPNIVAILILTLITVVMWVGLSVYHAVTTAPPPVVSPAVSEPLTPTLDTQAIELIESSLFLDDSQVPDNVVTGIVPTATVQPEPTPEPTEEPVTEPTPEASETPPAETPTPTPEP